MNKIIAITGPSGAGKTTLGLSFLDRGKIVRQSTTRIRRADDNENNFRYLSHEEFKKLADDNKFLFWSGDDTEIKKENGNFYGILKSDLENVLDELCDVIMFVSYKDVDAILELKKIMNIDIVHLTFENMDNIKERIKYRCTPSDVEKRIQCAISYEQKFGDKILNASTITLYTDKVSIDEMIDEVKTKLNLKDKYFYIGFNANNSICNENFFDGSFSIYPNGEKGNIYFKDHVTEHDDKILKEEYKKFVLSKITPDMKLYAFNGNVKKLFDTIKFETSPNDDAVNYLNDKFCLKNDLKNIVPILDFEILKGSEIIFTCPIVASEKEGAGGSSTFLINSCEDLKLLKSDTEYLVSKYFKNNPLNVTMIVSDSEVLLLSKSMQLIKITDNKFKYIGADFEFANHLGDEIVNKIKDISFKVANFAKEKGYRGILGIDLMQNENEIYFTEVNPRFQSSSFMISNELKKYGLSIAHLNDAALNSKKLPQMDEVVLHESFINCNEEEKFECLVPDYEIRNGYFSMNKKSNYRKIFRRSIASEIDIEKA